MQRGATIAVHPRVRGAHSGRRLGVAWNSGPSPCSRGSPQQHAAGVGQPRSIPAFAGLTRSTGTHQASTSVHPRVRGAHVPALHAFTALRGPSPRSRGSQGELLEVVAHVRSIPAFAGLTRLVSGVESPATVHPRVRGAHLQAGVQRRRGARSIPAFAGLTRAGARGVSAAAVHPRVRGAHPLSPRVTTGNCGPSPRSRGSRSGEVPAQRYRRSIPAFAGLTQVVPALLQTEAVHPRVRGAHSK